MQREQCNAWLAEMTRVLLASVSSDNGDSPTGASTARDRQNAGLAAAADRKPPPMKARRKHSLT